MRERRIWGRLRRKQVSGIQFYRQKPIGNYIVDFYAPAVNLIVGMDGGQHSELDQANRDERRTSYFNQLGLRVLRFNNRQVLLELDSVVEVIYGTLEKRKSP